MLSKFCSAIAVTSASTAASTVVAVVVGVAVVAVGITPASCFISALKSGSFFISKVAFFFFLSDILAYFLLKSALVYLRPFILYDLGALSIGITTPEESLILPMSVVMSSGASLPSFTMYDISCPIFCNSSLYIFLELSFLLNVS